MISFEQCDVIVNGSGILAESALLSLESPINPIYGIGFNSPLGYATKGGIQNSLQISYLLEAANEPNYGIVNVFKNYNTFTGVSPTQIVVCGVTGQFYLENYNISTTEHDVVKVNVSFVGFTPVSGQLQNKSNTSYNLTNSSGIAHSYSSAVFLRFTNPSGAFANVWYNPANIQSCVYSFKTNLAPIYVVGSAYPQEVKLLGAEENIEIIHENFVVLDISGVAPNQALGFTIGTAPQSSPYARSITVFEFILQFNPFSGAPLNVNLNNFNYPFISLTSGICKSIQSSNNVGDSTKITTTILRNY